MPFFVATTDVSRTAGCVGAGATLGVAGGGGGEFRSFIVEAGDGAVASSLAMGGVGREPGETQAATATAESMQMGIRFTRAPGWESALTTVRIRDLWRATRR